jgi:hypothetical protein
MRKIFLFILFVITFGCNTENSALKQHRRNWNYKNWNQNFKDRALCKCLLDGYGKKDIIKSIIEIDKSYYNAVSISFFTIKLMMFCKRKYRK